MGIKLNNSLTSSSGDTRYLKLDCTNDPLTAGLTSKGQSAGVSGEFRAEGNNSSDDYISFIASSGFGGFGGFVVGSGISQFIFNFNSEDVDYNFRTDGLNNAFFIEGSSGNVGVKNGTPIYDLDVNGDIGLTGDVYVKAGQKVYYDAT